MHDHSILPDVEAGLGIVAERCVVEVEGLLQGSQVLHLVELVEELRIEVLRHKFKVVRELMSLE